MVSTPSRTMSSSHPSSVPSPPISPGSPRNTELQRAASLPRPTTAIPDETLCDDGLGPPKIKEVPRHSPFGALLSRTLPNYTGPHEVGVCDLEIPVPRQTFGTFTHKNIPNQRAGIAVDTVLFTLFYPCEPQEKPKPVAWFPKLTQTIDGFLKMAKRPPNIWHRMVAYPTAAAIIHGTTFPANKDAPLAIPPSTETPSSFHNGGKWPLMLFSHGVGCSRLMYSAFCGEMASRGFVVAALEHRDGTSPSSTIADANGTTTTLDWVQWSDLHWPDLPEQPTDDSILRREQIKCRVAEIEAVILAMQKVSQGESIPCYLENGHKFDFERWRCLNASRPVLAGHSLGGGAALAASAKNSIDLRAVVVFDPAVRRLTPWTSALPHPVFVINSEEITVRHQFKALFSDLARSASSGIQIYTIGGSTHPSFSDVFLILPHAISKLTGLTCAAHTVIEKAVRATEEFLAGEGGHSGQVAYDEVYRDEEDMEWKMAIKGKKKAKTKHGGRNRNETETSYRSVGKPGELVLYRL